MIDDFLQDALAECGIDAETADIGGTDFQMRQFRAVMNAAGEDIAKRFEWSGLISEFTALSGVTEANLPNDYQELTERGAVIISGAHARNVTSPSLWQLIQANPSSVPHFHIYGGKIYFSPALTSNASIRYVSKNWLGDKSAITTGSDAPVFPEYLLKRGTVYRWRRQKSLPFDDLMAEFEADLETAIKADRVLM